MRSDRPLFAVRTDGSCRWVPNTYEGIKEGLNDATLDFIVVGPESGMYIDDEGMITDQPLNVAASMYAGRALYGPVVLTAAAPDAEGDTLPPSVDAVELLYSLAEMWLSVVTSARTLGQRVDVFPNPDTIPPPQMITFDSEEAFLRHLGGGED